MAPKKLTPAQTAIVRFLQEHPHAYIGTATNGRAWYASNQWAHPDSQPVTMVSVRPLVRAGYVERVTHVAHIERVTTVYRLTDKGKNYS